MRSFRSPTRVLPPFYEYPQDPPYPSIHNVLRGLNPGNLYYRNPERPPNYLFYSNFSPEKPKFFPNEGLSQRYNSQIASRRNYGSTPPMFNPSPAIPFYEPFGEAYLYDEWIDENCRSRQFSANTRYASREANGSLNKRFSHAREVMEKEKYILKEDKQIMMEEIKEKGFKRKKL